MNESHGVEVNWRLIRLLSAAAFLIAGFLLLSLSVYGFLRVGEWGSPTLADAAIAFGGDAAARFLVDWIGLERILTNIPLWLTLLVIGYFIAISE